MIAVNRQELLRYLGWHGQEIGPELDTILDKTAAMAQDLARPSWVHRAFPLTASPQGLVLAGADLVMSGRDIAAHLAGAERAVLMACTLGQAMDTAIRRLSYTDMTRSVILDAAANALIETVCDEVEDIIRREAGELCLTTRFSPGYGDLDITLQGKFLSVLDAGRAIGLSCTEHSLLTPAKSVTAVVGLGRRLQPPGQGKCAVCPMAPSCTMRKEETHHEA